MEEVSTYKCALCGITYEAVDSEEDAINRFHQEFPGEPAKDLVAICDNCFQQTYPEYQRMKGLVDG